MDIIKVIKLNDKFLSCIKYLELLGIPHKKPGMEALKEIIRTIMTRVPFENISKLYYFKKYGIKHIVSYEQYLSGMEQFNFGGTCYSNNYYLYQLLGFLGYEVKLCGADMSQPDVHIANIVTIDKHEYIVDVGYAAPFLEPIPRDLSGNYIISFGNDKYILKPQDSAKCSKLELYRNDKLVHGYLIKPQPRKIEEFTNVIFNSYKDEATFMNAVLLVKYNAGSAQVIHNMNHIEFKNGMTTKKSFETKDQLIGSINKIFGIPKDILTYSLDGLSMNQGVWD